MKLILVHYKAFDEDKMFVCDVLLKPESLDEDILDYIFRQCNHVDGSEWIDDRKLRSMSVGDEVIIIDQNEFHNDVHRYRCEMVGWESVGLTA